MWSAPNAVTRFSLIELWPTGWGVPVGIIPFLQPRLRHRVKRIILEPDPGKSTPLLIDQGSAKEQRQMKHRMSFAAPLMSIVAIHMVVLTIGCSERRSVAPVSAESSGTSAANADAEPPTSGDVAASAESSTASAADSGTDAATSADQPATFGNQNEQ